MIDARFRRTFAERLLQIATLAAAAAPFVGVACGGKAVVDGEGSLSGGGGNGGAGGNGIGGAPNTSVTVGPGGPSGPGVTVSSGNTMSTGPQEIACFDWPPDQM